MKRLPCLKTLRTSRQRISASIYALHRHRIVNYGYFQAEQLCSISSGAVESTIKQIDRRSQISGSQWNVENVPQVLAHRCAYLNGIIGSQR